MTNQLKMGNRASKRTKAQKKEIEKVVDKVITNNKNNLEKLKQSIQNTNSSTSQNEIVLHSSTDVAKSSMLHFIDVASQQLDKKGGNMTKTDLLAIIINLEPTSNIDSLNKLSVTDLNAMIRNIVYDPVRCEKRFQMSTDNQQLPKIVDKTKRIEQK
jgi:ribosomal protein L17